METIMISLCEELSSEVREICKINNISLEQFFFDAMSMHIFIIKELQRPGERIEIRRKLSCFQRA